MHEQITMIQVKHVISDSDNFQADLNKALKELRGKGFLPNFTITGIQYSSAFSHGAGNILYSALITYEQ